MIPESLSPLANHLWQSTLFAGAAGLLTLALRKNPARVRHWVWVAASLKFLIPFSLLVALGSNVGWRTAPRDRPSAFSTVVKAAREMRERLEALGLNSFLQDNRGQRAPRGVPPRTLKAESIDLAPGKGVRP